MPSEPLEPSPIQAPSRGELYDFFNDFILKWLKIPSQRADGFDDDLPTLPIEQGLLFPEPVPGVLVLRASEEFGKGLARLAKERQVDHDLFMEMLVVLWHRFASHFWKVDSRQMAPAFFKKSLPLHWPDRKPNSHLLVFILQQPVEIRLWLDLSEAEKERWKKAGK